MPMLQMLTAAYLQPSAITADYIVLGSWVSMESAHDMWLIGKGIEIEIDIWDQDLKIRDLEIFRKLRNIFLGLK